MEEMNALDHLRAVLDWITDGHPQREEIPVVSAARSYLTNLETEARSDWERDQAKKDRS